jgi:hypothetical protein
MEIAGGGDEENYLGWGKGKVCTEETILGGFI